MKRNFFFHGTNHALAGMKNFLLLWATQAFSALGSSMTGFALIIWSYQQEGSALVTALLSVCTYAPYVLMSIFAGALSDRWDKKRTMLVCDALAAAGTLAVFGLLKADRLEIWHLYLLNALSGLMNTVQQPASEVAVSLLAPKEQYQRVSGLQSFSSSLVTILTPVCATAVLAFGGMDAVIFFDLLTFGAAFLTLLFAIRIPRHTDEGKSKDGVLKSSLEGLRFLQKNRGLLDLIFFLAAINLVATMFEAGLPALVLSKPVGGQLALGWINTCAGIANLVGSILVSLLPAPKSRVRVICIALLMSMGVENLLLAVTESVPIWCVGSFLGWVSIPFMNANMNVLLRDHIPVEMQGRVYAARNTLQFFTIPVGYLLGGALVDRVFEPLMAAYPSLFMGLFGEGKGSGAALMFFLLAIAGESVCIVFSRSRHLWELDRIDRLQRANQPMRK